MFYRALDYLACPLDKTPFAGIDEKKMEASGFSMRTNSGCSYFCGRKNAPIDSCSLPCSECYGNKIMSGFLVCPRCGARYEIRNGIPMLLPASGGSDNSSSSDVIEKKNEIGERNKEAETFELKYNEGYNLIEISSTLKRLDLKGSECVLELGCGTGRLTIPVLEHSGELIGLDYSFDSLEILMNKYDKKKTGILHPVQGDINCLPFRKEMKFKRIFSSGTIQHLPKTVKYDALKEINRHLDGEGIFVVTVYQYSQRSSETRKEEGYHSGKIYFRRYDNEKLNQYLSSVFGVEEIAGMINLPTHKATGFFIRLGMPAIPVFMEGIIEKTPLSFYLGEMITAKCRKKTAG